MSIGIRIYFISLFFWLKNKQTNFLLKLKKKIFRKKEGVFL